ncbi:MAG: hypothetical protein ACKVP7_18455 [Hyphomicrobiaceae bacterium]
MTETSDTIGETLEALMQARDALVRQLEAHEAWRALCQLEERERRGETIEGIDAGKLRQYLEGELDRARPGWWAAKSIGAAIEQIVHWGAKPAPQAAPSLPPSPENNRVRVKIKAGTATVGPTAVEAADTAVPRDVETVTAAPGPPATRIAAKPDVPDAPLPPVTAPLAASATAAAATNGVPLTDVSTAINPASPPAPSDLSRIRLIDRIHVLPADGAAGKTDRFGGAVPWASLGSPPPAPAEPPRAMPQPALPEPRQAGPTATAARLPQSASTVRTPAPPRPGDARTSARPDRPVAAPVAELDTCEPVPTQPVRQGFAAGLLAPERAATRHDQPADPVQAKETMPDMPGDDRLSQLEAALDDIVGQRHPPRSGGHSRRGRDDTDAEDGDDLVDVDEAEVEIVPRRAVVEPPAPVATGPAMARPPVALSIRLKEGERAVEFVSDDYAAYHDDVGEADVEIIRPDRALEDATVADDDHRETRPSGGKARRFLKGFSRE